MRGWKVAQSRGQISKTKIPHTYLIMIMKEVDSVLTIAGSDSIGGAGIQADIKTIFSLGMYAASCITAVTAQNTQGVRNIQEISSEVLSDQIDAVLQDLAIKSIKIGMIFSKESVITIKNALTKNNYDGFLVLDPVLIATSGDRLSKADFLDTLKRELFPLCTIITPNIPEAEQITDKKITSIEDMEQCGKQIIKDYGVKNVLIKGGHIEGNAMCDVLVMKNYDNTDYFTQTFTTNKVNSKNTHGTGCTLSSAIACYLAKGYDLIQSIKLAKDYVYKAIYYAKDFQIGKGKGSTNHFHSLEIINKVRVI